MGAVPLATVRNQTKLRTLAFLSVLPLAATAFSQGQMPAQPVYDRILFPNWATLIANGQDQPEHWLTDHAENRIHRWARFLPKAAVEFKTSPEGVVKANLGVAYEGTSYFKQSVRRLATLSIDIEKFNELKKDDIDKPTDEEIRNPANWVVLRKTTLPRDTKTWSSNGIGVIGKLEDLETIVYRRMPLLLQGTRLPADRNDDGLTKLYLPIDAEEGNHFYTYKVAFVGKKNGNPEIVLHPEELGEELPLFSVEGLEVKDGGPDQYLDGKDSDHPKSPVHFSFSLDLAKFIFDSGNHGLIKRTEGDFHIKNALLSSRRLDKDSKVPLELLIDTKGGKALTQLSPFMRVQISANQDAVRDAPGRNIVGLIGSGARWYPWLGHDSVPKPYSDLDNNFSLTSQVEFFSPFEYSTKDAVGDLKLVHHGLGTSSLRLHMVANAGKYPISWLTPFESPVYLSFKADFWYMQRTTEFAPNLAEQHFDVGINLPVGKKGRGGTFNISYTYGANPTNNFERTPGGWTFGFSK